MSARLSDRIAEQLRALIQEQGLQAGDRLPAERLLAEQFGVSRAPVREAIRMLASRGVLASRQGGGTFVLSDVPAWPEQSIEILTGLMKDDPQYRYDVLESREALEAGTAWHAAARATPQDRDRIQRCFDIMVRHQQGGDADTSARADAQFHLAIAEASHNLVLLQIMRGLFDVMLSTVAQNRRTMTLLDEPRVLQVLTVQHQDLMQAICRGEPEQARQCIATHLDYVRQTLRAMDEDQARRQRCSRFSSPPILP